MRLVFWTFTKFLMESLPMLKTTPNMAIYSVAQGGQRKGPALGGAPGPGSNQVLLPPSPVMQPDPPSPVTPA